MKKEYLLIIALAFFVIAYALDYLAGPVTIPIKNAFQFFENPVISKFPFTAVAVAFRTLAIFCSIILLLDLFEEKFFTKAVITLFLGALAELYSIQQLATGMRMSPIQWVLPFAYVGPLLLLPTSIYLLLGIFSSVKSKVIKPKEEPNPNLDEENLFEEKSKEK